jgi:hypothetical protein
MKKIVLLPVLAFCLTTVELSGQSSAAQLPPGTLPAATQQAPAFKGRPVAGGDYAIVFLPIALFFIVLSILRVVLKGYDLQSALTENEYETKVVPNPQHTAANLLTMASAPGLTAAIPPTIEVSGSEKPKSASRYIALLTTCVTLVIGLSLTSFCIYMYINTGVIPDLGKVSSVLLTLGIGVVPYAFNKFSDAVKK